MAETDKVHLLCTGEGIVSGTPVHLNLTTESHFKYVKRCSSIVLSVRIYLNVFAEEEGGASALQDGVQITYDTRCGFDAEFSAAVDRALEDYFVSFYGGIAYPFEEQRVLDCSAFAILFRKPTAYSKIKLEQVFDRVRWPTNWNVRTGSDVVARMLIGKNPKISNATLKSMVDDSVSYAIEGAEEMLEFAVGYLTRFRNSVQTSTQFLEFRRWIIDGCLLAAMNRLPISLQSDYTFTVNDTRIGSGPLDYYFYFPESSVSAIAVAGRRDALDEDEDGDDDDDWDDEDGERRYLEAKPCLEEVLMSNTMGQMCAQSLDLLKTVPLQQGDTLFKKSRVGKGPQAMRCVNSILSARQQFFFFTFTEYEGSSIPVIDYCGKYSIDVLPKLHRRESGLPEKDELNRPKIMVLLRALHFFLREDI
eukprot:gene29096-38158_t